MRVANRLPSQHIDLLLLNSPSATSRGFLRPHIAARFDQVLDEVEEFLLTCNHEEVCTFWNSLNQLRQCLRHPPYQSEVPQFLAFRRKQRDFDRILEVLADLPYPKMHLSNDLDEPSNEFLNLE
jgi:hypothetical protein